MDTAKDIARDRYYYDNYGTCSTCKHEIKRQGIYYCGIMDERTDEIVHCTEWAEKVVKR